MSRQPTCPGCGAEVHPKAHECPECGAHLPRRAHFLPLLVGAAGVAVALLAGGSVWVLLSPAHAPVQQAAAPSAPPPPPPPVQPTPAPEPPPAAAAPQDQQLPLPNVRPGTPMPAADEASRKEFARTTQDSFVQNGLDLKVSATGPQATIMNLAFSFPAKTAVELIAGGPFPRQCKVRGFTSITFSDPSGAGWSYDLSTDKLSQK